MPASNILYKLLWVQEDERRARIVNPVEKNMDPANPGAFGFAVGPSVRAYIGRRTSDSQILRVKPSLGPASS
jgi:hypothetical protein